jgi:hypothetical protein
VALTLCNEQINFEVVKECGVSVRTLIPDQRREAQGKSTKPKMVFKRTHNTEQGGIVRFSSNSKLHWTSSVVPLRSDSSRPYCVNASHAIERD